MQATLKHGSHALLLAASLSVALPVAARADEVLDWNAVLLRAVRTAGIPPPLNIRLMAIVHAAMFDALNGIERRYTPDSRRSKRAARSVAPRRRRAGGLYRARRPLPRAAKRAAAGSRGVAGGASPRNRRPSTANRCTRTRMGRAGRRSDPGVAGDRRIRSVAFDASGKQRDRKMAANAHRIRQRPHPVAGPHRAVPDSVALARTGCVPRR